MPDIVLIKRRSAEPFGFKLQGGQDFSIPLSILDITPHTIAHQVGLRPGDAIIKINNVETNWMDHNRAKQEIMNAGNEFYLTVVRNAVNISKPEVTPLSALKVNVPVNSARYTVPAPIKTSLAVNKGPSIVVGSSHNRAPMPFNKNIGTSIVYQAAKPQNWQAGDYTRLNEPKAPPPPKQETINNYMNQFNPTHSQYTPTQYEYERQYADYSQYHNAPMKANLMEEIRNQTKVNTWQTEANKQQATTPVFQNPSQFQVAKAAPLRSANHSRSTSSLSMRMLDNDLQQCEGSDRSPASVFDMKRGNTPKGFRSVMAPIELPPDQRHAPMHKEYQVIHNKQSWIEPRML